MDPSGDGTGGHGGWARPRDAKGHFIKAETPAAEDRRDRPPLVVEVSAPAAGVQAPRPETIVEAALRLGALVQAVTTLAPVPTGPTFHYETHCTQCGEPLPGFLQPHGLCGDCLTAGPSPGLRMPRPSYGAGEP